MHRLIKISLFLAGAQAFVDDFASTGKGKKGSRAYVVNKEVKRLLHEVRKVA